MGQTQFRSDDTVKWWLGFGNGSDGDYSSVGNATDAPIDSSCSGTAASTSLSATNASFANGKPILIHQTRGTGAGNWELNQIDSYTSGTITLKKALQNTYTDSGASQAQVIQLKQYNNFTQNSGHTLTAKAWDGNVGGIIAFLAKGTVTITGTLSASGRGCVGPVIGTGDSNHGFRGEGNNAGNTTRSTSADGTAAGGGGRGINGSVGAASGGGGGHAASGTAGQTPGSPTLGAAGGTGGNAGLTNMIFGGSGGTAGGFAGASDRNGGDGGNSGGIIFIIARTLTQSGSGTLVANGSAGTAGLKADDGGGGGGSGGSILIKSEVATLGTTKLTATAGSGGAAGGVNSKNGGAGAVGRIHLDYSGSYTGTTSPTLDATLDPTIKAGGPNFFAFF